MAARAIFDEALKLPPSDRLRLMRELWSSLVDEVDDCSLTEAQRAELERRLDAHFADPDAGYSWEEVRERVLSRNR